MNTVIDSANRYSSINGVTVQNVAGGGIQSFGNKEYSWDGLNQMSSANVGGTRGNGSEMRSDGLPSKRIRKETQPA